MIHNIVTDPKEIEIKSFETITEILGDRTFPQEQEGIIKRVIHTSADFDYADNLVFGNNAIESGIAALKKGGCTRSSMLSAKMFRGEKASPGRSCIRLGGLPGMA